MFFLLVTDEKVYPLPRLQLLSVLYRAICGACGPSRSTPRPAAPASWRYDAPWDKRPARGGLRILYLELEGRREGALTVRPCCHHLFMLSANLL